MGLKLEDYRQIPGVELRAMTTKELKKTLSQVAKHTNARLSRLQKAELEHISKSGDVLLTSYPHGLSGKGITNRNDLIRQITAGQRFLSGSTSTVRGTKKMIKNILDKANVQYDKGTVTDKYIKQFGSDFWEIYRKLSEVEKSYKEDSDGLIQAVNDVMEKKEDKETNEDEIEKELNEDEIDDLVNKAKKRYEDAKVGNDIDFVSDEDLSKKYSRKNN